MKDGRGCEIRRGVNHGVNLFLEILGLDADIGGEIIDNLVLGPLQYAYLASIAIFPPGCRHKLWMFLIQGIIEINEMTVGWWGVVAVSRIHGLVDFFEQVTIVILVNASLGKALGNDGRLLPFQTILQLNEWVK